MYCIVVQFDVPLRNALIVIYLIKIVKRLMERYISIFFIVILQCLFAYLNYTVTILVPLVLVGIREIGFHRILD